MKKIFTISLLVFLLLIAPVIGFYFFQFNKYNLSNDPSLWGSFGDYIGGVLNPILSFVGFIALLVTLAQTQKTNLRQWQYLEQIEKKREWLTIIEHTEKQLHKVLDQPVERNDGLIFSVGDALLQSAKIVHEAGFSGVREYSDMVLKQKFSVLNTNQFNPISSLLGSLAIYIKRYSMTLVEEDAGDIVSHYVSTYIGYISALQWIGVMCDRDYKSWNNLIFYNYNKNEGLA